MEDMELPINQIICGDCLEVMKTFPDKSIDLVLTDPPYGMNYQSNHYVGKNPFEKIVGDNEYPVEVLKDLFKKAKKGVFSFCRWNNLNDVPKPKSFIVWAKNNWTAGDLKREFGRMWEGILFYPQEDFEFNKRIPDVFFSSRVSPDKLVHPTEKPLDVMKWIIQNCTKENDIILDPFLGSGTTAVAAKQLHRRYIGIEISQKYCEIAKQRLGQEVLF